MVEFTSPTAARLFFANCPSSSRERLAVAQHGFSLRYTDPAAMLAWCEAAAARPLEAREEALRIWPILDQFGIPPESREAKLLAEVVEKGSEAALIELAAALRALARSTGASPTPAGAF